MLLLCKYTKWLLKKRNDHIFNEQATHVKISSIY